MNNLIDQSTSQLNMPALEKAVHLFYQGNNAAQKQLLAFSQNPNSKSFVVQIIRESSRIQTKSFGLTILLNAIKTQWDAFSPGDRPGMRSFAIKMLLDLISAAPNNPEIKALVPMVNNIIIELAKKQWPGEWPEFVPELLSASKKSDAICSNNMQLLQMLVEEVNENDARLTSHQKKTMQPILAENFLEIYKLCLLVFENSQNTELINSTLRTLNCYIPWLQKNFIFESTLIKTLLLTFLPEKSLQNNVMRCLGAIVNLDVKEQNSYVDIIKNLYKTIANNSKELLNENLDLDHFCKNEDTDYRPYILFLTNFLVTASRNYGSALDSDPNMYESTWYGHLSLIKISSMDDTEIFNICLEYWDILTKSLLEDKERKEKPIALGRMQKVNTERLERYSQIMSKLRQILLTRMERPREVLIGQNQDANLEDHLRGFASEESYNATRHALMVRCLHNCTKLNSKEMRNFMYMQLSEIANQPAVDLTRLNTLCWAIGAASKAFDSSEEKELLIHVIKELLTLCNTRRNKQEKAAIASCIMYIMGQYPRFLRARWRFLKTVVNKLFEFMRESFPGMKEMAVETYGVIARDCAVELCAPQADQSYGPPLIYESLESLETVCGGLEEPQQMLFYEANARVVAVEKDTHMRKQLLEALLKKPNQCWSSIIQQMDSEPNLISNSSTSHLLTHAIRLNTSTARGMGPLFDSQMGYLYESVVKMYHHTTNAMSLAIARNGIQTLQNREIKQMIVLRSEILKLFEVYIGNIRTADEMMIATKLVPALYNPVLSSYVNAHPLARDPNVLSLSRVLVEKIKTKADSVIKEMFGSLIKNTLEMVNKNFSDYPDHRIKLYELLRSIVRDCFKPVMELSESDFDVVLMSIVWGIRHQDDQISRIGLETIGKLFENLKHSTFFSMFYNKNMLKLISELLSITCDTLHSSGFEMQAKLLANLFFIVQNGDLTFSLFPQGSNFSSNRAFIKAFLVDHITKNYQGKFLNDEMHTYAEGFIRQSKDFKAFREVLNDFRIKIKN